MFSIKTQPDNNPCLTDECCQCRDRFLSFLNKCTSDENRLLLVKLDWNINVQYKHARQDTSTIEQPL